jgi:Tfp pilus assembly protein PilF
MSVINSVLRDLESRRAAPADRDQLPDGLIATSPAPAHAAGSKRRYLGWLLLPLAGAVLAYLFLYGDALQLDFFRAPPPAQPRPLPLSGTSPAAPPAPVAPATAPAIATATPDDASKPAAAPSPPPASPPSPGMAVAAAPLTPPPASEPPKPSSAVARPARNVATVAARAEQAGPRQTPATPPTSEAPARPAARNASVSRDGSGEALKTVSPRQRAQALYNQALNSLGNGRSTPAKALLEEALAADPGYAEARQLLASLQAESGQNDAAETTLAGGLAYAPPPPLVLALARLRLARAGDEAGFRLLMEYQHTAKDSADYQAFLGTLLLQRKQWAEAGHRYANALRLNPRPGAWWAGYGLALFGTQQYSEAHNALTHAKQQGGLAPALLDVVNERLGDLKRLLADKEPS